MFFVVEKETLRCKIVEVSDETLIKGRDKAQEAEQNDYRFEYLNAEMSSTHEPAIFGGSISAVGQEAVSFRPSHKPHDRLWG